MDARALTEEAPRSAADLAADALDVCEEAGIIYAENEGAVCGIAWQMQRLARQVAELAQLVDVVPAEIVDDEDSAAVYQVAAILERLVDDVDQSDDVDATINAAARAIMRLVAR